MFVANDCRQAVLAADALHQKNYTCPGCGQRVILRKGEVRIAHFAHLSGHGCHVFSEGETQIHLSGKQRVFDWCRQNHLAVKLEAYLPKLKQRPDILVYWHHHWTAIEFQCSPISFERLCERTRGYHSQGYKVWWILGPTYLKKRLTLEQVSKFSYFQKKLHLFMSFYNPKRDEFLVRHHLHQDLFGKLNWQVYRFVPSKMKFDQLFLGHLPVPKKENKDRYQEALELQRRLLGRYCDSRLSQIQRLCYVHHLNLAGCPWLIHDSFFALPTGVASPLEIKIYFLIQLRANYKKKLPYQTFSRWFEQANQNATLIFPNIRNSRICTEMNVKLLVNYLATEKWITCEAAGYRINQQPDWYSDLSEKLRHFCA